MLILEYLHIRLQTGDVQSDPCLIDYSWLGGREQGIFKSLFRQALCFSGPVCFDTGYSEVFIECLQDGILLEF